MRKLCKKQDFETTAMVLSLRTDTESALWKGGHFKRAKSTLKMLPASWTFNLIENGFGSLNAENLGSVGERALKMPAVKI